jgi:hypothetical protein
MPEDKKSKPRARAPTGRPRGRPKTGNVGRVFYVALPAEDWALFGSTEEEIVTNIRKLIQGFTHRL